MSGANAGNSAGLLVNNKLESFISPSWISGFVKEHRQVCNVATMLASKQLPADMKDLLCGGSADYAWTPRTEEESVSCGMAIDETTCNFQNDEADNERLEIAFRSVKVCHQKKGTFKLPRALMARACDNGAMVKGMIQKQISNQMDARLDNLGLRSLPGYASIDNIYTTALGTIAAPLANSTDADVKAWLIAIQVRGMQIGMNCAKGGSVRLIVDPVTYGRIVLMIGNGTMMCSTDNALITGEVHLAMGLTVVPSARQACYSNGATFVRYATLVDTRDFFMPFKWLYGGDSTWQMQGHDMILPFNYIYDSIVFDPESVIVATLAA